THMGRHLTPQALDLLKPLNWVLQRDERYWAIVETSQPARKERGRSRLELRSLRRLSKPNALILIIAQAMADLGCLKDWMRARTIRQSRLNPAQQSSWSSNTSRPVKRAVIEFWSVSFSQMILLERLKRTIFSVSCGALIPRMRTGAVDLKPVRPQLFKKIFG